MIGSLPARLVAVLLLAPTWTVALAFLVKGHSETGDGFSAGLTAATGVLVHTLVLGEERSRRLFVVRHAFGLATTGLLLVLAPVVLPVLAGRLPLHHVPHGGHPPGLGALELHSGFVLDVGVACLVVGFVLALFDLLSQAARHGREERG